MDHDTDFGQSVRFSTGDASIGDFACAQRERRSAPTGEGVNSSLSERNAPTVNAVNLTIHTPSNYFVKRSV
jgi:hypothetical protein